MLITVFVGEEVRNVCGGVGGGVQQKEDEEELVVVVVIEQVSSICSLLSSSLGSSNDPFQQNSIDSV
ncbi:hypothetical protein FJTKL_06696 [Diaporthe vaccinii]|uniref:Uncharacterized protein n=1 Tax=Diaporthe vaccinii TaxID=105482 RepID=A0ABR4EW85_9PEZI